MDRQALRDAIRDQALARAPELGAEAVSRLLARPRVQAWLDRREQRRPHGIVAAFRRLFGRPLRDGLTASQQQELADLVRRELDRR